jgi:hypothetical protein
MVSSVGDGSRRCSTVLLKGWILTKLVAHSQLWMLVIVFLMTEVVLKD